MAVAAALILVLLAHTPVARAAALRYALATVQRNYGLTLRAERLDYNLLTLRIGLAGLRVSAQGSPDEPFFEGDYASVSLPAGVFLGNVSFKDISVTNGRVLVHRRADGTSTFRNRAAPPTTRRRC